MKLKRGALSIRNILLFFIAIFLIYLIIRSTFNFEENMMDSKDTYRMGYKDKMKSDPAIKYLNENINDNSSPEDLLKFLDLALPLTKNESVKTFINKYKEEINKNK